MVRHEGVRQPDEGAEVQGAEKDAKPLEGSSEIPLQTLGYHRRMRFHTEYLKFQTKQHRQYINITTEVDAALKKSGIREGMILVSAMHITAGVWVNDAEDGLLADIDEWLEKLAPFRENYRHHRTGETNGDSHLKSLIAHHQVIVPVTDGKLDFGPWQQVYYAEFDGQRPKRVIIKVMGE
jgi:secondary thiamine-phosphate synthase enzyme